MLNATAPDLLSPTGSSTGHNSSLSNNIISPELHEMAYQDSSSSSLLISSQHQQPHYISNYTTTADINQHHDNSNNFQAQQQQTSSSSSTASQNNSNTRKVFKTEYKSKFTPFDQYVYHEASDSFVKQNQLNTSNSRASPLPGFTSSRSNQDLTSISVAVGDHHPPSSNEGSHPQGLNNGHHQQHEAGAGEQFSVASSSEPWYKEVVRRNEKANEYRFKSELGHNSPLLNFNRLDSPTCERHLLSPTAAASEATFANSETTTTPHLCDSRGSQVSAGEQHEQLAAPNSTSSEYKQPHFKFTPSDYRQRDHLIAHMANNNNFNLPKEQERCSPAGAHSNSRRAAQLNSSSPAAAAAAATANSTRVAASRTTAQVRSRSQSTRRQPLNSSTGATSSSSKAAPPKTTTTTTTRSNHTTPTHTTKAPISSQRVPSASRVSSKKPESNVGAQRAPVTPAAARSATPGSATKTSTTPGGVAARRTTPATSATRANQASSSSRLTNGARAGPVSASNSTTAKRLNPVSGVSSRQSPITPGLASRTRPVASATSSKMTSTSSRVTPQRTAQTHTRSSNSASTGSGKVGSKSASATSTPPSTAGNNEIKSIKTPAAAAAKAELDAAATAAAAAVAAAGIAGVATLGFMSEDEPSKSVVQQPPAAVEEPSVLVEQPITEQLFDLNLAAPLEEENNLIFTTTEAGNMLADELAHAEREASNRTNSEQQVVDLSSEPEPILSETLVTPVTQEPEVNVDPTVVESEPKLKTDYENSTEIPTKIEIENENHELDVDEQKADVEHEVEDQSEFSPKSTPELHEPELSTFSGPKVDLELSESAPQQQSEVPLLELGESVTEDGPNTFDILSTKQSQENLAQIQEEPATTSALVNGLEGELISTEDRFNSSFPLEEENNLIFTNTEAGNMLADELAHAESEASNMTNSEQQVLDLSPEPEPILSETLVTPITQEPEVNVEPTAVDSESKLQTDYENSTHIPTEIEIENENHELAVDEQKADVEHEVEDQSEFSPKSTPELHEPELSTFSGSKVDLELSESAPQQQSEVPLLELGESVTEDGPNTFDILSTKQSQENLAQIQEEPATTSALVNGLEGGLISTEDRFDSSEREFSSNESNHPPTNEDTGDLISDELPSEPQELLNNQVSIAEDEDHDEPYSIIPEKASENQQASEAPQGIVSEELEKVKEEDEGEDRKEVILLTDEDVATEMTDSKTDPLIKTLDNIDGNMIDVDPLVTADIVKQSEQTDYSEQEKEEEQHGELHRQLNISQHERKLSSSFTPDSLRRRQSTRSSSSSSSASSSASSSLERVVQGDIKSDYDELAAQITADLIQSSNNDSIGKTVTGNNG